MISEPPLPPTYWLTRDRIGGELANRVDVWAIRPERYGYDDGDVIWAAPENANRETACVTCWRYADAVRYLGPGVPETDRECTRVGHEPIIVPAVS